MRISRRVINEEIADFIKSQSSQSQSQWEGLTDQMTRQIANIPRRRKVRQTARFTGLALSIIACVPIWYYSSQNIFMMAKNTTGSIYSWNLPDQLTGGMSFLEASLGVSTTGYTTASASTYDSASTNYDDNQNADTEDDTETLAMDSTLSDVESELTQLKEPIWDVL